MVNSRKIKARHGIAGAGVLVISQILMAADIRPFTTWFYALAWWSYIFIVDNLVYIRRGNSLWMNRRSEFLLLIPMSVAFWMIFEGLNIYLKNWQYHGITPIGAERWFGYFISYGTVLPGVFETYELLDSLPLLSSWRVNPISSGSKWEYPFAFTGLFFIFAPVFQPCYFFPLIWGGFVFLLEPFTYRRSGISLMKEWERGSLRTFALLLLSGLICGMLWEFWNYWAESKWVYTVPYVGGLKIFEMPLLGFLGFPPFAVELYVMTNALSVVRGGKSWKIEASGRDDPTPSWLKVMFALFFAALFIGVSRLIDIYTIKSYL